MKRLMFLAIPLLLASPAALSKHAPKVCCAQTQPTRAPAEAQADGRSFRQLPAGAQMAVVSGDPTKTGKFVLQLKMPTNYSVPAHWHPTDDKVTLVSGKLSYGMSDRLDKAAAQPLAEGASVTMKAKMHHWVLTGDGATVQVEAMGPFEITYVDPSTDPRGAAKPKP